MILKALSLDHLAEPAKKVVDNMRSTDGSCLYWEDDRASISYCSASRLWDEYDQAYRRRASVEWDKMYLHYQSDIVGLLAGADHKGLGGAIRDYKFPLVAEVHMYEHHAMCHDEDLDIRVFDIGTIQNMLRGGRSGLTLSLLPQRIQDAIISVEQSPYGPLIVRDFEVLFLRTCKNCSKIDRTEREVSTALESVSRMVNLQPDLPMPSWLRGQ